MENTRRIEVVDAMRGFAILCILLLHSSNHFLYDVMPENSTNLMDLFNKITKQVLYFLFEGKAFGIFAILFGFTYGIQYSRSEEKGEEFRYRFLWRMLLLAVFGFINAAFFSGGDPLVFMAIVAIILPLISGLKAKIKILIAIVLFLQPLELYKTVSLWLNPDYQSTNYTEHYYNMLKPFVSEGNFIEMVYCNITTGIKACLAWALEYGRVSQTPVLYIVGFLLCRHGLFSDIKNRFWNKLAIVTLITTPVLFIFRLTDILAEQSSQYIHIALNMWYNLSFMFLLVALFVIAFRTDLFKSLTTLLQVYGKMSLTNFILQSVICTFLFYPFGLNLSLYCGVFVSVLIGIAIAIVQIIFTIWWLRRHRQGPFEYLWHKATYLI